MVCAALGAALTSVSATWIVFEFEILDFDTKLARLVSIIIFAVAVIVLLVWFAMRPRSSVAIRRFWLLAKLNMVVLGLALWIAAHATRGYFFPA